MACLLKRGDIAAFVPRGDTAANQDGKPSPDADWLLADGQPVECRRVRVRLLGAEDLAAAGTGIDGVLAIGRAGFVDLDGDPDFDALLPDWRFAIGLLALAVAGSPLIGRPFRWTERPSPDAGSHES